MQVRLRFVRDGSPVEPDQKDLAEVASRYITHLAAARFGKSFKVEIRPASSENKRESKG